MGAAQSVSVEELKRLHDANPDLKVIDVRTPAEFQSVRAHFAKLVPLDSLKPMQVATELGWAGEETLYVFCGSGVRANMACEAFLESGYSNVRIVEGGIKAWDAAGLPVIRGRKAISLERQMRIAAGTLVLLGVALGFAVHPGFFGLSGFVGAGLVFAGITDTCPMGMLIARMPWNKRKGGTSCAC